MMNALTPKANDSDRSPLIIASRNGCVDTVTELLTQNDDGENAVNATDKNGWTALIHATWCGHHQVVAVLLEHGANIEAKTKYGHSALLIAAEKGHVGVVSVLLHHHPCVNTTRPDNSRTPLMLASAVGCLEVVGALVAAGAVVDATDTKCETALSLAAKQGHADVVKLLLARGATVDKKNAHFSTALACACRNGHDAVALILLQHGASVDALTELDWISLIHDCHLGTTTTVRILLLHGAASRDVHHLSHDTPMMIAAWQGCVDAMASLRTHDAAVHCARWNAENPLSYASCDSLKRGVELTQLLLSIGDDARTRSTYLL